MEQESRQTRTYKFKHVPQVKLHIYRFLSVKSQCNIYQLDVQKSH